MGTSINSSGITFPDATTQVSAASGAPGFQQYTSGSGNFTVPPGITQLTVGVTGGGGSGGTPTSGCAAREFAGGGGGGGGSAWAIIAVTPGQVIAYVVGTGGAAVTATNTSGNAGQTSSFGSYITCTGGAGGQAQQGTVGATGKRGTGGAAGTTTYAGTTFTNLQLSSGGGSGGYFGDGGTTTVYWVGGSSGLYNITGTGNPLTSATQVAFTATSNRVGLAGTFYGAGGQGGYCYATQSTSTSTSGAGSAGYIAIFW